MLTPAQRASVSSICGHSSAVTKDFYLLRDRVRDARNCAELSRLLCGAVADPRGSEPNAAAVASAAPDSWEQSTLPQPA